jgi:hypothetical protein
MQKGFDILHVRVALWVDIVRVSDPESEAR